MNWVIWGAILLLQNASFTWTSRARNSGSLAYNAAASIFSNGIWFIGQLVVISNVLQYRDDHFMLGVCMLFYTVFCVIGSVAAQYILMKYVESGKRKVGA